MKTFVLRARKSSTRAERFLEQRGEGAHAEIIAHTAANVFFYSNGFRKDAELFVCFDSSPDFPRTVHLDGSAGLSIPGFHEDAVLGVIGAALEEGDGIGKDEVRPSAAGVTVAGFGFDRLMGRLLETRPGYLLDDRGEDIRSAELAPDPVFVLSDHLAMPRNSIKGMERRGLRRVSLGRKVLFASQCVVLVHNELDRRRPAARGGSGYHEAS